MGTTSARSAHCDSASRSSSHVRSHRPQTYTISAKFLQARIISTILAQRNILISGGTGTGKTTLLNALADTIPATDRIVLIEETSEILINKPNLVRFEARRAQTPLGHE